LSSSISAPTTSAGASARATNQRALAPVTPPRKAVSKYGGRPVGSYSVLNGPSEQVRAAEKPGII